MRITWIFVLALSSCVCSSPVARKRAEIDATPTAVDFGRVEIGATLTRDVVVSSRGAMPLQVSSITLTGDAAFSILPFAEKDVASGDSFTVTISFSPRAAGSFATRLSIESSASETPQLWIPVIGTSSTTCVPQHCSDVPKACGSVDDGCGGHLDCSCTAPETCGGGGTAGRCGCAAESDAAFCTRLGKQCGSVTDVDSCGVARTASCGTCTGATTCNTANQCVCTAESDAAFCTRLGKHCGPFTGTDSCGATRTANCGTCAGASVCGGDNECACTGESDVDLCSAAGRACGTLQVTDRCGTARSVTCGSCPGTSVCGANGVSGQCGCVAETDAAFCARTGKTCGTVTGLDTCGQARTVASCGTCSGVNVCGAANTCVCTGETESQLCQSSGHACGTSYVFDRCGTGRNIDCGVCAPQWVQRSSSQQPTARGYHQLVYDAARQETVLFGGRTASNVLGDTWAWNGSSWTQRASSGPAARRWFGMAYDSGRQRVVLFGGSSVVSPQASVPTQLLNDTWEWDGSSWTRRTPAHAPEVRYSMHLGYDSQRQRVVLFGGVGTVNSVFTRFSDTWEWDGNDWIQQSPTASPPPRDSYAMGLDSTGRVIIFGGFGGTAGGGSGALADTWRWTGATWASVSVSSPAGYNMSIALDATRQRVVRFGGNYPSLLDQTWEFDGNSWAQVNVATTPPARAVSAMAYDSARGKVVMFGGENNSGFLGDTWEYP